MEKIDKKAVLDAIKEIDLYYADEEKNLVNAINALPAYKDEDIQARDELLFSMGQTNTALANRVKMYLDKYGEI